MRCSAVVRPGFHPLSIALMVGGFMIAWPIGLAMLGYMLWGDRLAGFADGLRQGFTGAAARHGFTPGAGFGYSATGNAAFDAYRASELERLEAERRRLDEERREFEAYMTHLRRARDQEEFDRFKAERTAWKQRSGDPTKP
ncbi:DUF2852 domain-containing protein [Siculibacillus lacustris]|uniref:DUF2852 domain-containing protein n=1 Tax=Siculibacillus lacustris TaxID=1549641 RepID=A0A4Q9W009_9HYPH|nr:DUF2852 domain-containing protein [Siculibacillus lacustris]TBW41253.1 DUF2852 domain-containing protein [Siculibacillus lacustris]